MNTMTAHRHPLALGLMLALGISVGVTAPTVTQAVPPPVVNCDDIGAGSLRAALSSPNTVSGDTIDLTQLTCSLITLNVDELTVSQHDLTIVGPGADQLAISGNHAHRVLDHAGAGTLSLSGIALEDGSSRGFGGCLSSPGSVALIDAVVSGCVAVGATPSDGVYGGGVYTGNDLSLTRSALTGNTAYARSAAGGGAFVQGGFSSKYSTISDNIALAIDPVTTPAEGGGVKTRVGQLIVTASTFSANAADIGGALMARDGTSVAIQNSTFSENAANRAGSAIYMGGNGNVLSLFDSTVVSNGSVRGYAVDLNSSSVVTMRGTLMAGNEMLDDGHGSPQASDIGGNGTISGDHNLIAFSSLPLPMDTISECPRLGPLADNGGHSQTHALLHDTLNPAIDSGADGVLATDQRELARPFGAHADIGAFEWSGETDDRILASAFEPVCD